MWTSGRPDSEPAGRAPGAIPDVSREHDPNPGYDPREERQLSLFRVGALTVNDRRELCLIRNVSSGGMQIRLYSPIADGTRVAVEFKQGDPISGTVAWQREAMAGVQFDRPVDVDSLLAAPTDGPRPRMPRIDIDCHAVVREGATLHRGRIKDISQGGIRVQLGVPLAKGTSVVVTIGGLPPEGAVVAWASDGEVGLAFNRVLSVPQLVEFLKHQDRPCASPRSATGG